MTNLSLPPIEKIKGQRGRVLKAPEMDDTIVDIERRKALIVKVALVETKPWFYR